MSEREKSQEDYIKTLDENTREFLDNDAPDIKIFLPTRNVEEPRFGYRYDVFGADKADETRMDIELIIQWLKSPMLFEELDHSIERSDREFYAEKQYGMETYRFLTSQNRAQVDSVSATTGFMTHLIGLDKDHGTNLFDENESNELLDKLNFFRRQFRLIQELREVCHEVVDGNEVLDQFRDRIEAGRLIDFTTGPRAFIEKSLQVLMDEIEKVARIVLARFENQKLVKFELPE